MIRVVHDEVMAEVCLTGLVLLNSSDALLLVHAPLFCGHVQLHGRKVVDAGDVCGARQLEGENVLGVGFCGPRILHLLDRNDRILVPHRFGSRAFRRHFAVVEEGL